MTKFNPMNDYKSSLDEGLEADARSMIRIIFWSVIGLIITFFAVYAVPWKTWWGLLFKETSMFMWVYALYLFVGLLCGFCAGLILASLIQHYKEKRRMKYGWGWK